ncbi:MAG: ankyrin repeat domain-containing protein [Armatimonadota bacterium]
MERKRRWEIGAVIALVIAVALGAIGTLRYRHVEWLRAELVTELQRQQTQFSKEFSVDITLVSSLVEMGAPADARTSTGWTALTAAVAAGEARLCGELLKRGADPNVRDERGWTALTLAMLGSNPGLVRQLLEHRADPNLADGQGKTPLMTAVSASDPNDPRVRMSDEMRQHLERESRSAALIVELLLAHGAEVDAKDPAGDTALKYAIQYGQPRFVRRLLEAGADVHVANRMGNTPLAYAVARGRPEVIRALEAAGAKRSLDDAMSEALRNNDAAEVGKLLQRGAKVNARDRYSGETVLIWASRRGDLRLIRELLKRGAALDERDQLGWTPLLAAVAGNKPEAVRELLSRGADSNARMIGGKTSLSLARSRGNEAIIRILLEAGATS